MIVTGVIAISLVVVLILLVQRKLRPVEIKPEFL